MPGNSPPLRYRYQTIEFGLTDIHVRTLRDNQQFSDPSGIAEKLGVPEAIWPLAGLVWESSLILARLMQEFDIEGKRILEVGCGVGVTSLLLNHRTADITATDHHPDAGTNLEWNVLLNNGKPIPFVRTDWGDNEETLGRFDLIIGSDLLYQPDHAALLAGFIGRHATQRSEVIIVDPSRGNAGKFSQAMQALGYQQADLPTGPYMDPGVNEAGSSAVQYKGQIRRYCR